MSRLRNAGFTLIELMVTVAVVAILAAIAFPSFQGVLRSNRVASASNDLLTSFTLARSEAIRNTRGAGVCASSNGTSCGNDWGTGWLVWADSNGNGSMDAGENVVRYSQARGQMDLVGSTGSIGFDARGRALGGQQSIDLKPAGLETPARCVIISGTGQVRIGADACQ
jgi:type IV fimbrial biogenesis protein FimT